MAAIAEAAETAIQTIYDSVGPKRAIILALVDLTEEDAGVTEMPRRVREARDPRALIALQVGLTRQFMEHSADVFRALQTAAPVEADVDAALRHASQRHRGGAKFVARAIAELGGLREGMTVERAGAILAVLTWGTTWLQFTQEHGWSLDACERWITEVLEAQLLADRS
jgi:hypothetical protein